MFIPANTWISAKDIGTEPVSLTFIFSAPGFEDTMRCNSVPAGENSNRDHGGAAKGVCTPRACRGRERVRTTPAISKDFGGHCRTPKTGKGEL